MFYQNRGQNFVLYYLLRELELDKNKNVSPKIIMLFFSLAQLPLIFQTIDILLQ